MKKLRSLAAILVLTLGVLLSTATQAHGTLRYANALDGWNTNIDLEGKTQAEKLLAVAKAQVGKNGEELNYGNEWCAMFISDCARLAGVSTATINNYTYAAPGGFGLDAIDKTNYIPKQGDLIFYYSWNPITLNYNYDWGHVGIVDYVDDAGKVHSIEGNAIGNSDSTFLTRKCGEVTHSLDHPGIRAYASPNYIEKLAKDKYTEQVVSADGHIYAYYPFGLNWQTAKEKCESFGGHLVTITSAEEQAIVAQLTAKAGKAAWIGATRGSGNAYSWVTGEPFSYTNWADKEPTGVYGGVQENCIALYAGGTWNDLAVDSGSAKGFICEWEGYVTDASKLEGEFYIVSALNTNKAIDIYQQSTENKAAVHLWDFHGGNSQIFQVTHVGDEIIITNKNSGKTLDVKWGWSNSGTSIWQWNTNQNRSQRFLPEYVGNGYFMLKSALGHYLDAKGGYTDNGTTLQIYTKNDTDAQKWRFVHINQSCSHSWEYGTEEAHPHRSYQKCQRCGKLDYTSDGSYNSSCTVCNPECSHSWSYSCEASHPHRDVRICSKCGEKEYTNNGTYYSNCSVCNPECSHSWSYSCEHAHPHRDVKTCSKCGEREYMNNGTYDSSCAKCNPSCNHAWTTGNDSAHPHNEYRVCTKCGESSYTGKTGYNGSCSTCTYKPEWGAWSEWSTTPVSASSTRQVETKTQYVYYHYQLTYDDNNIGTYPINMETANYNFRNFVNAHVKAEAYHEYYSDSQLPLCSGRLIYYVNGQNKVWDKYSNYCTNDVGPFSDNANYLYYKGTQTCYRYRDYK